LHIALGAERIQLLAVSDKAETFMALLENFQTREDAVVMAQRPQCGAEAIIKSFFSRLGL